MIDLAYVPYKNWKNRETWYTFINLVDRLGKDEILSLFEVDDKGQTKLTIEYLANTLKVRIFKLMKPSIDSINLYNDNDKTLEYAAATMAKEILIEFFQTVDYEELVSYLLRKYDIKERDIITNT